jgi:hypothetical protein
MVRLPKGQHCCGEMGRAGDDATTDTRRLRMGEAPRVLQGSSLATQQTLLTLINGY